MTDKFDNENFKAGGELSGLNVVESASKKGIAQNLIEKVKEKPIQSALVASTVLPLLAEEEEPVNHLLLKKIIKKAYKEQSKIKRWF